MDHKSEMEASSLCVSEGKSTKYCVPYQVYQICVYNLAPLISQCPFYELNSVGLTFSAVGTSHIINLCKKSGIELGKVKSLKSK